MSNRDSSSFYQDVPPNKSGEGGLADSLSRMYWVAFAVCCVAVLAGILRAEPILVFGGLTGMVAVFLLTTGKTRS